MSKESAKESRRRPKAWLASCFQVAEDGFGLSCKGCDKTLGLSMKMRASRQKDHLLKCASSAAPEARKRFLSEDGDSAEAGSAKRQKPAGALRGGQVSAEEERKLNESLIELVFGSGLRFNIVNSPFSRKLAFSLRSSCKLPSCRALAGPPLDALYGRASSQVTALLRSSREGRCGALCFDGWENVKKENVINALFEIGSTSYFITSMEAGSDHVAGECLAKKIGDLVEGISGSPTVAGVASDNAAACVKAKDLMCAQHPNFFSAQGAPHAANLLMKNLMKMQSFAETADACKSIRQFVFFNQFTLTLFRDVMKERNSMSPRSAAVELAARPGARFEYLHLVLSSVLRAKRALVSMVDQGQRMKEATGSIKVGSSGDQLLQLFTTLVEHAALWRLLSGITKCVKVVFALIHQFEKEV